LVFLWLLCKEFELVHCKV